MFFESRPAVLAYDPVSMRWVLLLTILCSAAAAAESPLFFREDWTESPPSLPVTDADLTNRELTVTRHGPGGSLLKKSFHDFIPNDPHYIWSGLCRGNWALSLRRKDSDVDLTAGRVRWRAKQSGFRMLRVVVKTGDGKWLVSDAADEASDDWRVRELDLDEVGWRELNVETVVEGRVVESPDLSRVEEVGFTDLMAGGRSRACSRLDWIEVYGPAVPR